MKLGSRKRAMRGTSLLMKVRKDFNDEGKEGEDEVKAEESEGWGAKAQDLGFGQSGQGVVWGANSGYGHGAGRCSRGGRCWGASQQQSTPTPPKKGKNFTPNEERQLTRSVLLVSQDSVVGNQQKNFAYWKRIASHYDNCRPGSQRSARSLEIKWGQIKHDVSKFIGVVN